MDNGPASAAASGDGSHHHTVLANYRLGKTLGIGSFGKVKVAEHIPTGHKVAIKILNRKKIRAMDMDEKVLREIKILRLFMHPHIIRLYEVIDTPTDIFVVMEYVQSGELFDYIVEKGRLAEDEARRFFQQIVSGVEYCHRNMVVHRDLKPENLLLDNKLNVKIADFGLSNVMRDGHFLKTSCGSPNYAAPEVISGRLYSGPEVDVWSCGVILYALLCGSLPFDDENIPNLFKKIKGGIYALPTYLSAGARDLIPGMLRVEPLKRMTIPEIRGHPWFSHQLPRYLSVPPPDTLAQIKKIIAQIDPDILDSVVKLGYDRDALLEQLRQRHQTQGTVAYYLMLDNRGRSTGYLITDYLESKEGPGSMDVTPANSGAGPLPVARALDLQRIAGDRRWHLGVVTRVHPADVMGDVYRALQVLGCRWKKIGNYNVKCRYEAYTAMPEHHFHHVPNGIPHEDGPMLDGPIVMDELELYKLKEEKYILDMQRIFGPHLLFLDFAANFLAELRIGG
eukprot:jgi/Chlat1/5169/Chrsp33S00393